MVKFSFDIYRTYLAAGVIIATMLLARSRLPADWSPEMIRVSGLADFLLLGFLALVYRVTGFFTSPESSAGRLNGFMHWIAALLVIVLAWFSQALFLKTGELLNLDMLAFFLRRNEDLKGVAAGAVDIELLAIPLLSFIFLLIASLRFTSRSLIFGQCLALSLPIGLVLAGPLIQPGMAREGLKIEFPERLEFRRLYQGKYRNLTGQQMSWNSSGVAWWQQGILTGMPVSSFGESAIKVLAKDAPAEPIYEQPHAVHGGASHPNILFVILESFRFDAMGTYSSTVARRQSNTPFLDGLARKGWQVERAYTTIPHTSKALVGIYCGTFARMETNISEAIPGNLPLTCLPRLLSAVGYRTAHFQTAIGTFENRLPFLSNVGFDERFTQESFSGEEGKWTKFAYLGMDDHAMIGPSINWMRRQKANGVPFFASMLTITTHHPYVTPTRIEAVHEPVQAKKAYDDAVRYTDNWMRELFGRLQEQGLLDNTLVVITGDHGEAFFEHGLIGHNGVGYEEGIRVPLILSGSMLGQPKIVHGLRQHIDIMPTVLDVAGVTYAGKLPGKSLREDSTGHSELMISCFYQDYCLTHLSSDGGKEIFFYGKREIEMYDLGSDPLEQRNLYAEDTQDNALQRLGVAMGMKMAYEAVYRPADTRLTTRIPVNGLANN